MPSFERPNYPPVPAAPRMPTVTVRKQAVTAILQPCFYSDLLGLIVEFIEEFTLAVFYNSKSLVRVFSSSGKLIRQFGGKGNNPGQFSSFEYGCSMSFCPINRRLWTSTPIGCIQLFSEDGKALFFEEYLKSDGIACHPSGKFICFCDSESHDLAFLDADGEYMSRYEAAFIPYHAAWLDDDLLVVLTARAKEAILFSYSKQQPVGSFECPDRFVRSVCVDRSTNEIFIGYDRTVYVFDSSFKLTRELKGEFDAHSIDVFSGLLFVPSRGRRFLCVLDAVSGEMVGEFGVDDRVESGSDIACVCVIDP